MTKTQFAIATVLLAAATGTASAQTPAPAAKPMAAPAAAPAAKPAVAPAAAPAAKPAAAAPAAAPAAAAPAAAPAAAAAPPKPMPSKELAAFMTPFVGSWKCDTKFAAGAMGPGSPEMTAKSTVKFSKDLNGFFYRGDYDIKKQKGFDMPMKGTFYIGWDPGTQEIITTGVDTAGGLGVGAGKITGDTVTYTGESRMMGMKMKTRETMGMKAGGKEGFHKMEIDMGKGFMPMGEDNCKK